MKICSEEFKTIEREIGARFEKYCDVELKEIGGSYTYKPQLRYDNKKGYPYLPGVDTSTEFCYFKPDLPKQSGDYLWVVDEKIVYIGQAKSLYDRFNSGYGHISPRNCFKGGQSTNIKMNRAALNLIKEQGKTISIYIYKTDDYDRIEKELLARIETTYNVQNN